MYYKLISGKKQFLTTSTALKGITILWIFPIAGICSTLESQPELLEEKSHYMNGMIRCPFIDSFTLNAHGVYLDPPSCWTGDIEIQFRSQ